MFNQNHRRIAEVGTGHLVYATFSWFFDNILYVFVVFRMGLLVGGTIMTALSLALCAATLLLYERMQIDWVGAGSLSRLSYNPNPSRWQRIIFGATRRSDALVFLVLCIFQDPFITTAYFRRGRFDGLTSRDWRIFFSSVFVSNFYWTLRSGAVGVILFSAWRWLIHSRFQ